jgi:glycine/D-amino acid oxidase-like deaminating enzyme
VRAYELGLEAIGFIRDLIGRIGDPCGFAPRPSLYFASNERDGAALQAEFRAREAAGLEVELLGPGQVGRTFPFSAPAAIYSQGDAEIDAYRFSALLVQAARERGLRVRERTAIVRKEDEGGRSRLFTDEGRVLTARQIVFATGYESERFLRQKTGRLCTTYAFVSHPLENLADWPERCLLWETARPYLYARTSPDGRALVGGEDHPWAGAHRDEASARRRVGRLAQRFGGMFPDLKIEVSAWWAGVFAESKDGLAYIGPSPEYANAYFALGYGGNGITYGAIAALVLADLCRGRPNRDADLFRFDR